MLTLTSRGEMLPLHTKLTILNVQSTIVDRRTRQCVLLGFSLVI